MGEIVGATATASAPAPYLAVDLDLDSLLQGFSYEGGFDFDLDLDLDRSPVFLTKEQPPVETQTPDSASSDPTSGPWFSGSTPEGSGSGSSFVNDIERFLLEEDDEAVGEEVKQGFDDERFAELLLDGSDSGKSNISTPTAEPGAVAGGNKGSDGELFGQVHDLGFNSGNSMEEDNNSVDDEFFAKLLLDGSGSDSGKSEASTPEAEPEMDNKAKEKREASAMVNEEEGDSFSKKRRRQLRNRDSAMKSRERKKMYINELEMKSKYLESECRRLEYALQCCTAENLALHQRLQKERPLGAHAAKQESAVLFVESLLLGSLFWLVSIVCLFLVPGLCNSPSPKGASRLERGLGLEEVVAGSKANESSKIDLGSDLVIMRRRCRGLRTRMKHCLFPLLVLPSSLFLAV